MSHSITLQRAYDHESKSVGKRILVDRLWPRGIKKEDLELDEWLKQVAPSNNLRKWFGHDAERWDEFQKRYRAELDPSKNDDLSKLFTLADKGPVTLIYAAADEEHNNAVVLRDLIKETRSGTNAEDK